MADGGLWTWGDRGMPAPGTKLGNELRAKARAANEKIVRVSNQMLAGGLLHSIAVVRQSASSVAPEDRANVIAGRYVELRESDIDFLTQLAPHIEQAQNDLIAPYIPMIMSKISTLQGARAFQEMLSDVYQNTSSRQYFGTSRRLTFGDAVLGVKTAIDDHSEDFRELFGLQRPIYVVRSWPNPMAIVDPVGVSAPAGSSLAQTMQ